jgi:hypothetical protein
MTLGNMRQIGVRSLRFATNSDRKSGHRLYRKRRGNADFAFIFNGRVTADMAAVR